LKNEKNKEKMKKDKNSVVISNKSIEDFIWMSYRYCIGRKTIAASTHAGTIADIIFKNPDLLSRDRKEMMAVDIRQNILDVIRWNKRIRIRNHYGSADWDFYALLLEGMNDCPYPKEAIFCIDMETRTLTWEKAGNIAVECPDRPDDMYHDLIVWMKLANALDESCHKDIIVNLNGEEKTIRCFPYTVWTQGEYKGVWASVEKDANSNITQQGYVIPELITNIDNIKD
jgi:hypothetical protein